MKIVLDSNVIIASFAARGICSEIYRYLTETSEIILSEELINECEKGFLKKIKLPKDVIQSNIDFIRKNSTVLQPVFVNPDICRDPDDLHVLGVALAGNVRFIVTGDEDLLIVKKIKNIKIYSPRQFWNYLNAL
jgi:putative PIN family toxin of toxin-antitoxin system